MKAIFKREFSAYIHSVVGLLFMAVTVFFFGLIWHQDILMYLIH